MENKEELGKMTLSIPKSLMYDFRTTVKKSGYTQTFLLSRIMKEIIKELKEGELSQNVGGGEDEKQQSL